MHDVAIGVRDPRLENRRGSCRSFLSLSANDDAAIYIRSGASPRMVAKTTDLKNAEFDAAVRAGDELVAHEPRAVAARFDAPSGRIVVDLANGCMFAFPARALQGLGEASDSDLATVEVVGSGYGLHWEPLDADFSVPSLLMGLFGARDWAAREQARRAGATKSAAKAAAACRNGAKGGRPRHAPLKTSRRAP